MPTLRRRGSEAAETGSHPFRSLFDLMVTLVFLLIGVLFITNTRLTAATGTAAGDPARTREVSALRDEMLFLHNMERRDQSPDGRFGRLHDLAELGAQDPCGPIAQGLRATDAEYERLDLHRREFWKRYQPELDDLLESRPFLDTIGEERIRFASGADTPIVTTAEDARRLDSELQKIYNTAYEMVAKRGYTRIRVEGHTDHVPPRGRLAARFPTNWELSAARAIYLVRKIQTHLENTDARGKALIEAIGYGETRPEAPGASTPEDLARNRRIVVVYEKRHEDR